MSHVMPGIEVVGFFKKMFHLKSEYFQELILTNWFLKSLSFSVEHFSKIPANSIPGMDLRDCCVDTARQDRSVYVRIGMFHGKTILYRAMSHSKLA